MEFHITYDAGMPDAGLIEDVLQDHDPAAVVDLDAATKTLRMATWIEAPQLVEILNRSGWAIQPDQVIQQPSVCCGGCGG